MAEYSIKDTTLTGMADQIRTMHGTTDAMAPSTMIEKLQDVNTEISDQEALLVEIVNTLQGKAIGTPPKLQSKTVTPSTSSQTVKPDEGCDGLAQVVVNGYSLQNKTVIPSDSTQIIIPDTHYNGLAQVTVNGDANLVAENIAEGVSIFGVTGTHAGGSGGTADICTVVIKPTGAPATNLCYTTVDESGQIISLNDGAASPTGKEIVCVCGTIVTFGIDMFISINVEKAEVLSTITGAARTSFAVKITAEPGGTSIIKPMADMGT